MNSKQLNKIIKRAMRGDKDAFTTLYQSYAKTILYNTQSLLYNKTDTDDVAQEIVIKMLGNITKLSNAYAFNSWLHQIIFSTCSTHNAKQVKQRNRITNLDSVDEPIDEDQSLMPEQATISRVASQQLMAQIEQLPDAQRAIVVMYYFDEMSYKEIAEAMGVEIGTVSSNLSKAKKKLAQIVSGSEQTTATDMAAEDKAPVNKNVAKSSVAGAVIFATLHQDANASVTPDHLRNFLTSCGKTVEPLLGALPAATLTAKVGLSFASKAAVAAAGLCVATAIFVGVFGTTFTNTVPDGSTLNGTSQNSSGQIVHSYTADAVITLKDADGKNTAQNPKTGSITVNDNQGKVIGWAIKGSNGTSLATGTGTQVSIPGSLSSGSYTLTWQIQNDKTAISEAQHTFTIDKNNSSNQATKPQSP